LGLLSQAAYSIRQDQCEVEGLFKEKERWVRALYLRGEDGPEVDDASVYLTLTVLEPSDPKVRGKRV